MAAATPPGNAVIHPRGPVACADIKGHDVGFYYPFGAGSFPPPNPGVTGLMIYAFDGGATGDKIGFAPVLANANADCSLTSPTVMGAKATALPVTSGNITITQKGAPMMDPTSATSAGH